MHLVWLERFGVFKGVLYPDWNALLKRYQSSAESKKEAIKGLVSLIKSFAISRPT